MKKINLGIALILFAILLKLCTSGTESLALFLGVIGLVITFLGCFGKTE